LKNYWLRIALFNFLVVACLGLFLRWFLVLPPAGFNYKYWLHAHSHVALLGWLYTAVFIALWQAYLPSAYRQKKVYSWQFWSAQLAVAGMLFSFPVQGYALFSITFSTLHILISYWFVYQFLKDARSAGISRGVHQFSFTFIKAALFFLVLSTLGPWSLGPIMATGHSGSHLYFNAIYFYLHFQYNGWLSFAVFGLLFWLLEHYELPFDLIQAKRIFRLFFWSCLISYLLSVLWIKPALPVYFLAGGAALLQVAGLFLLLRLLCQQRIALLSLFNFWGRFLFLLSLTALTLKIMMQAATALPYMADLAYNIRNFIIGYLHLVLIGFITFFLFAFFIQQEQLQAQTRSSRWGLGVFLAGFVFSEALLFLQGVFFWMGWGMLPAYFELLFGVGVLFPVGLILFQIRQKPREGAGS